MCSHRGDWSAKHKRNVELMWLTGRLAPDFKTIADFRKDNGEAIRAVCREFVMLCRKLNLLTEALVAIDGSKFKAVNNRDRNFTRAKMKRRLLAVEASIERYMEQLAKADREEVTNVGVDRRQLASIARQAKAVLAPAPADARTVIADQGYYRGQERLACANENIVTYVAKSDTSGKRGKGEFARSEFHFIAKDNEYECPAGERLIYRFSREEVGKTIRRY